MKQTITEVINKLTIEYNELAGRIGALERFMICEGFQKVTNKQKILLARQRVAMKEYKEILVSRLIELRNQEDREKAMTCALAEEEPRAPMCKCVKVEPENLDGTQTN